MRDLSDPYEADRRQQADVRRQKASTMLQNSSITQGGLRVASANGILAQSVTGGNPAVRVTGLQVVDGVLRITGTLEGSGAWSWTGPWTLSGNGSITGDVTSTGTLTQNGPWNMNGAGNIAGNVIQTGNTDMTGNFTVGANGKITVGSMVIDPTNGGSVTFPGGAVVRASAGGGVAVVQGSYSAVITSAGASVGKAGLNLSVTDAVGFQFVGLTTITQSASGGLPVGSMYLTATNQPRRVVSG